MKKLRLLFLSGAFLSLFAASGNLNAQEFDRGIVNQVFVPKGQWLVGGAFSYSQFNMADYDFLILSNMDLNGYTLNINPFAGYFIKDNMALGVRFGYNRSNANIDRLDLTLFDDLGANIQDYSYVQHVYSGTVMMRNYISIGEKKRFGLFNEVRLTAGGGQGKFVSGTGEAITGTYQNIYEFQLGLAPGLVAFVTNSIAVEASVGIMGLQYKKITQTKDQVYEGSYDTSGLNFKFDLFSINLGISFYISPKK